MNRYIIEGIIRDVIVGKRVGVVAETRWRAREFFTQLVGAEVGWDECRLAHGMEMVRKGAGGVMLLSATPESPRGRELDVVVMLDGLRSIADEKRQEFLDSVSPTRAELILCE